MTLNQQEKPPKWTGLHQQAVGMTVADLIFSPPKLSELDVNAKGPCGMNALHLISCRAGYDDELKIDNDDAIRMISDLMILRADC